MPFRHFQFMAQSFPQPQIVTMLGKGTRPSTGPQTCTYPSQTTKTALQPLAVSAEASLELVLAELQVSIRSYCL